MRDITEFYTPSAPAKIKIPNNEPLRFNIISTKGSGGQIGVYINTLEVGCLIWKKGIRIGDQILAINNIRVFGMSHFKVCDLLFKKTANQFLTLLVKKKGGYYNGVHYIPPKCYYCGHTSLNQMTLSVIYCTNCKNHM